MHSGELKMQEFPGLSGGAWIPVNIGSLHTPNLLHWQNLEKHLWDPLDQILDLLVVIDLLKALVMTEILMII